MILKIFLFYVPFISFRHYDWQKNLVDIVTEMGFAIVTGPGQLGIIRHYDIAPII